MSTSINLLGGSGASYRDPEISPEGPTTTEPLTAEAAARNETLVAEWAERLYDETAENILDWAHTYAPENLAVTMSMENTVLAELANDHLPNSEMLFLDTGYHFPETLDVADQVEARYPDIKLVRATSILDVEGQNETYGAALYRSNPTACCRMRKVEPMARNLSPYAGWITGLRRVDSPTRAQAPALSLDGTGRLKISPMITWTLDDTQRYIEDKDLIVHPLTLQGYPSIGCAPCTSKVAPGEDPRAGRWAGQGKVECGLHE